MDVIPEELVANAVDELTRGLRFVHALIGPCVIPSGHGRKVPPHYFVIVSGDDEDDDAHIDCLGAEEQGLARRLRIAIIAELMRRRPCVIELFDDELEQCRMAAVIWPNERMKRILADMTVELER